jgi:hypothetical protein
MSAVIDVTTYEYDIVQTDDLSSLVSKVFFNGRVKKTYRGETAWQDAQRYALDLSLEMMYKRS